MEIPAPLFDNCRVEFARDNTKYHPLILEGDFSSQLMATIEMVDLPKKHEWLRNLYSGLESILTCCYCKNFLQNVTFFSCGHTFCEPCLQNSSFCLKCSEKISLKNFDVTCRSNVLDNIKQIKNNFNVETVLTKLIQFIVRSVQPVEQRLHGIVKKTNFNFTTPTLLPKPADDKKLNRTKSTSKRSKILSKNPVNTKSATNIEANTIGDEKILTYFNPQKPTYNSPHIGTTVLKTQSKNVKRKLFNGGKNILHSSKLLTRNFKKPKIEEKRKLDIPNEISNNTISQTIAYSERTAITEFFEPTSEVVTKNDQSSEFSQDSSSQKRRLSMRSLVTSSDRPISFSPCSEGIFFGFQPSYATKSLNKLKLMRKCFKFSSHKLVDLSSQGSTNNLMNVSDKTKFHTETNNESQIEYEDLHARKNSRGSVEKLGSTSPWEDADPHTREGGHSVNTTNLKNMSPTNCPRNAKSVLKMEHETSRFQKENVNVTLIDSETEDIVDIKLWDSEDKRDKKKKSLFKSVKERNKRNVLLKILDERAMRKGNETLNAVMKTPLSEELEKCNLLEKHQMSTKRNVEASTSSISLPLTEFHPSECPFEAKSPVKNNSNATFALANEISVLSIDEAPSTLDITTNVSCKDTSKAILDEKNTKLEAFPISSVISYTTALPRENILQEMNVGLDEDNVLLPVCPLHEISSSIDNFREKEIGIGSSQSSHPELFKNCFDVNLNNLDEDFNRFYEIRESLPKTYKMKYNDYLVRIFSLITSTPLTSKSITSNEKTLSSHFPNESMLTKENEEKNRHFEKQDSVEEIVNVPTFYSNLTVDREYSMDVKRRCVRLKRFINKQNQKSFVDLQKNFGISSPQALLVTKMRTENQNSSLGNSSRNENVIKSSRNLLGNTVPDGNFNEVLTVPRSPTFKSVACQTTPDLHIALLKQEFSDFFKRDELPLSIYNMPIEFTTKFQPSILSKTPDGSFLIRQHEKYTCASSVTLSENKIYEKEFDEKSVLGDSSFYNHTNSPADISCIVPLPNSTNKAEYCSPDLPSSKFSARLDFIGGKDTILAKAVTPKKTKLEMSLEKDVRMSVDGPSGEENNSSASGELEFSEVTSGNQGKAMQMQMFDDGMKENVSVFPDTAVNCFEDLEIFVDEEIDKKLKLEDTCKSATSPVSDEEDVDFVAGTPTSSVIRCVDEISKSQHHSKFDVNTELSNEKNEKSHLLFDSLDCRITKSQTSHIQLDPAADPHTNSTSASSTNNIPSLPFESQPSLSDTRYPVYLATSGLREADLQTVKVFCEKFRVMLLDKMNEKCTHLVVKTDAGNQTCRTFKYLQAIVGCICIVSINWILKSLQYHKILNEEDFIPKDSSGECGPLRAYSAYRKLTPSPLSWLSDYCIFFTEPVPQGCTLLQLQKTIRNAGAVVVNSLKEMDMYRSHHRIIIISDDDENVETFTEDIREWLSVYRAVAIEFNWLLEVIGRNRLVPFVDYEFIEIPVEYLQRLNFPSEILQTDTEIVE